MEDDPRPRESESRTSKDPGEKLLTLLDRHPELRSQLKRVVKRTTMLNRVRDKKGGARISN
jgi:hypothetical protein